MKTVRSFVFSAARGPKILEDCSIKAAGATTDEKEPRPARSRVNRPGVLCLPDGLEIVGINFLWNCCLKEVVLLTIIKSVEPGVFYNCNNLKSTDILDSAEYTGRECRMDRSLERVTFRPVLRR